MKKSIALLAVFFLLKSASFAQNKKAPYMEVTGYATKSIAPDQIVLSLNLSVMDADFSKALDELNRQTIAIKVSLAQADVKEEDIRTANYQVREELQYQNGKRNLVGYRASHSLKLKFGFDEDRLKKIYSALIKSGVNFGMNISFSISSPEKYRNELMIMAVEDAKMKADVLAKASGGVVSGVRSIHYGQVRNNYQRNVNFTSAMRDNSSAEISVNPQDLNLSETVQITYYIE